jgi:hypothetical protein
MTGVVFTCTFIWGGATQHEASAVATYAKSVSSRDKWGKIALEAVKERYPNVAIVDSEYVGRFKISGTVAEDVFKMWFVQGSREHGLFVRVSFDKPHDRLLRVQFQETDR